MLPSPYFMRHFKTCAAYDGYCWHANYWYVSVTKWQKMYVLWVATVAAAVVGRITFRIENHHRYLYAIMMLNFIISNSFFFFIVLLNCWRCTTHNSVLIDLIFYCNILVARRRYQNIYHAVNQVDLCEH